MTDCSRWIGRIYRQGITDVKTSIATVSISGTLDEKLEAIAAAGYDGIELFEQDFIAFDGSPKDFRKRVQDHGLEISMFQPLRDFEGLPEPLRAARPGARVTARGPSASRGPCFLRPDRQPSSDQAPKA